VAVPHFHALVPGAEFEADWHRGRVPANIEVGENTVVDSSFCFKQYQSTLPLGLKVGRDVTFWRTSFAVLPNGYLEVGDECHVANALLIAAARITIGARVLIAGGVTIVDSDFHPLSPAARVADSVALSPIGDRTRRPRAEIAPVVIEDDVWIGPNATILKGVRIGAGATVQPGAVVTQFVRPGATVVGNPARETT
jgi:acetyltransferase-like isoleucine patch superfamily enzyme